jgi:hypothetical protein
MWRYIMSGDIIVALVGVIGFVVLALVAISRGRSFKARMGRDGIEVSTMDKENKANN